ncbi:calcium/sodium antiporter [Yoonia vestfoldensis]|uniref:Inner membrane protein YrbG n=1 Tax=Yoonia vestfoldensis TaxID=245188 RepID=A0A1Y0EBK8_9RHOB|nr:calcium/sodium antiporter [Yoonia vestfoldensis]ARU00996.1 inner membrane protein YrbG [Yoonia vestfoldensis]
MLTYLILIGGLLGLFLGGDWLVKGASGLALRFGVAPMIVGAVVVGFGTSTPELLVSLNAALGGQPGIAIGNVIGSNIANILLVLGTAAVIGPLVLTFAEFRKDLLWMAGAVLILPYAFWSGEVSLVEGLVLVGALAVYLVISLKGSRGEVEDIDAPANLWANIGLTLLGLGAVVLGAHYLVQSASIIARDFGISEAMIGLSIVAIGTSLPELATTVMAAIRGERDIALGNIVGSNIFNILAILGITAVVTPVPVDARFMAVDTPVVIAITLALLALVYFVGRMNRLVGGAMLAGYVAYIALTGGL